MYVIMELQFTCVLHFQKLPYRLFHGDEVIDLQLNAVKGPLIRYLLGSYMTELNICGRVGGFEPFTLGHDAE